MNKIYQILAMLAFVFAMSLSLGAYEKSADALKAAKLKAQSKDYMGAVKDADEAVSLAGENANEKIEALFFKGQIAEWSKDFVKAKAEYAKVASDGKASTAQRVMALNKTAGVLMAENKMDEARAEYAKIAGIAGATHADIMNAKIATAKSYERQMKFENASGIYTEIHADPASPRALKVQAIRGNAAIIMGKYKYDESRAEYAKILSLPDTGPKDKAEVAMDIARTYEVQKDFAKAREEYSKASGVEGLDKTVKAKVLAAIARTYKDELDLVNMKKTMTSIAELVPAPDYSLLRDYANLAAFMEDSKEEVAIWTQIMAIPGIANAQYADAVFRKIGVLAASKQIEEAMKLATDAAADTRMSEEQKFLAALLSAGFNAPKEGMMDIKSLPVTSLNAEKQAKLYTDAAKVFMRARNYEVAKLFGSKSDAMFPAAPRNVYECKFMDKAPVGVSGWQNSDIVKDPSRRETRFEEYDKKAAAVLINDVNAVRDVGTGDAKKNNASFYMAADSRGWHIYVHCKDDQVEQVLAGLTGGGSLEMFFVPGKGECYYQWIMRLPSGETSFYPWMSPNRNFRKMDDCFKAEVAPVDDGFGVYMFFPWDFVYDKIPKEGDLWTFGLVNWSRSGGFTWGSGEVHELNKFGKVKFSGVEKYMPAIKRAIVMKAFANYKKAAASATTFWKDEVKGDQNFYNKVLLPKIEKFNELGKLVKPEMTRADTDMLFEQAVPDWMEFDYLVSELRSEYLQNRLIEE
jgi:hypothetical protein